MAIGITFLTILIITIEFCISEEMSKAQAKKDIKVHIINAHGNLLLCNVVDLDSKNLHQQIKDGNVIKTDVGIMP